MKTRSRSTFILALVGLVILLGGLSSAGLLDTPLVPEVVELLGEDRDEGAPDATAQLIGQLLTAGQLTALQASYTPCTSRTQLGCLRLLRQELVENPITDSPEIGRQMALYLRIVEAGRFHSGAGTSESNLNTPWGTLLLLDNLHLAHQSTLGSAAFLSALKTSSQFWQLLFGAGDTLLAKMVAVAGLWNNAQYASQYLAMASIEGSELLQLEKILVAMPVDPAQLTEAIHREFVAFSELFLPFDGDRFQALFGVHPWISALGLQPQATLNAYYRQVVAPSICMAMLASSPLNAEAGSCMAEEQKGGWSDLNPVGNQLVHEAGSHMNYVYRVHDLNDVIALVRFQAAQHHSEPPSTLVEFMRDPERVNRSQNILGFRCLDTHSLCEIQVNTNL
jgi:hypothetical protein